VILGNRYELWVMDVFTTELYRGNPAAVVFDATGLSADTMQAIAREMNLSETAFVLMPMDARADYRVRFFTPRSELPFAGHPTVAVAAALVAHDERWAKLVPGVLRQECGLGIIPVTVSQTKDGGYEFTMTQTPPSSRDVPLKRSAVAKMLGCPPKDLCRLPTRIVSTGVPWLIIPLVSPAAVAAAKPVLTLVERVCSEHVAVGATIFAIGAMEAQKWIKVRTFAPGQGVAEDPVCGSGNGSVAAYIAAAGLLGGTAFRYTSYQGAEVARAGRVSVHCGLSANGLEVRIGGQAVNALRGHICT
jgi:PhzF family phenazine biosynthesis protein